jgi:PAS domain S-box-containing protein
LLKIIDDEINRNLIHKLRKEMKGIDLKNNIKINAQTFKIVAEKSNNGIAITDLSGNIKYINKSFAEIHGYSPSELIGKNLTIFHSKEQLEKVKKINKNLKETGSYSGKEVWHKHKNGKTFPMLMNAIIIKNEKGEPQFMASTAIDISVQKKAQERYESLFETSRDAIMILEPPDWKFTRGNPTAIDMFKAKSEEDLCLRAPWHYSPKFQSNEQSSKQEAMNKIQKALGEGSALFEWTHKRLNGETFPASVLLSRMEIGGKKVLQATVRDITDQKRAEMIRIQNIKLKEMDKKKNDFITMAAHELKTPLVSINGYVDYIFSAYEKDLKPQMEEDLNIIKRNIERLGNYMNQLLDVLKIDESKMKLKKAPTNLSELIKRCIRELTYLVEEKNQTIEIDLKDDPVVNIDSGRLFQVISNLLSNSLKFTKNGGKIEINTIQRGSEIIFKIKDNGIGIKKEYIENIFEKFQTYDSNIENYSNNRGTGLGLYISRGIIEAHGGKMSVFSKGEGKGATFTFSLPL